MQINITANRISKRRLKTKYIEKSISSLRNQTQKPSGKIQTQDQEIKWENKTKYLDVTQDKIFRFNQGRI